VKQLSNPLQNIGDVIDAEVNRDDVTSR